MSLARDSTAAAANASSASAEDGDNDATAAAVILTSTAWSFELNCAATRKALAGDLETAGECGDADDAG